MQTAQEKQGGQPVWKRLFLGVAVALGTLALVPSTALAQEESTTESDNTLEEVIVTATRREESLMEVVPRLEKRTHYLATFANIATLLGLLGTIIGLIRAFTAVSAANPAEKADLLSASISVAMNTTAFGLMVAIPLLLLHALLQTKTTELVDSLEMASVKFLNTLTEGNSQEAA